MPEQLVEGLLYVVHPTDVPPERLLHLPNRRAARDNKVCAKVPAVINSFRAIYFQCKSFSYAKRIYFPILRVDKSVVRASLREGEAEEPEARVPLEKG